ncbi:hypothetical protein CVT24_011077 [Panaeolus cyanescens]|uniref:Uncharacterized protein n=1 Tax=Panaeolus cyanescens TaxID=181874 RepID=A0A409YYC0_9AGAR|nr:hypothetical protein CVT24_011077 [Panaeolus cyanescens]
MTDPGLSDCLLPNELILDIFQHLSKDRKTLHKLLFFHPSYRTTIERALYSEMSDWVTTTSFQGFIKVVADNTRLASYVQCFAFCEEDDGEVLLLYLDEEATAERALLWEDVIRAIKSMVNLKRFLIRLFGGQPPGSLLSILQTRKLESFRWSSYNLRRETLARWSCIWQSQASLVELSVSLSAKHLSTLNVQLTLSNLLRFAGNWGAIKVIMPCCPNVTSLVWRRDTGEDSELTEEDISKFSAMVGTKLASFAINNHNGHFKDIPIALLRAFRDRPHAVRCLQLPLTWQHDNEGWGDVKDVLLSSFPILKYLIIAGSSVNETNSNLPNIDIDTYFSSLFSDMSSLQTVYIGPIASSLLHGNSDTETRIPTVHSSGSSALGGTLMFQSLTRAAVSESELAPCMTNAVIYQLSHDLVHFDDSITFDDLSHAYKDGNLTGFRVA